MLLASLNTTFRGTTRSDDLAGDLYEEFLEKWPTHHYVPRIMYERVLVLSNQGRQKEAQQVLDKFELAFPDRRDLSNKMRRETGRPEK